MELIIGAAIMLLGVLVGSAIASMNKDNNA